MTRLAQLSFGAAAGTRRAAIAGACALVLMLTTSPVGAAIRATAPPVISGTTLPAATQGSSYSVALSATGGTAPYTWSLLTGAVPLGLVLSSVGTIAGIPGAAGTATIALRITDALGLTSTATLSLVVRPLPIPPQQLVFGSSSGVVTSEGTGTPTALSQQLPTGHVVGIAVSPTGRGSWVVNSTGRVATVGGVVNYGGVSARRASSGIAGIAVNPTGTGYWIVTKSGHVYGFGAARSRGSLSGLKRRNAVVGITSTPRGGYYLVQANGKVTGFGGVRAHGSVAARRYHVTISGIASMTSGSGYWVVTTTGRVFRFGNARSYRLSGPVASGTIVAITPAITGVGFYLVTSLGLVLPYGTALHLPNVGIAAGDSIAGAGAAV